MEMAMTICMKESRYEHPTRKKKDKKTVNLFVFLPDDIFLDILKKLPDAILRCKAKYVCRRWCNLINNMILLDCASSILQKTGDLTARSIPSISIKLEHENYCLWRSTIISALETFELESFVLAPNPPSETRHVAPSTVPPTMEPNPDYLLWKKRDRQILLWLKSMLGCSLAIVAHAQTRARRMSMKHQLQILSKGSLSMLDYVERKRAIADSLAANLNPVSNEDVIGFILNELDSSYGPFTYAFMIKDQDSTIDDLIGLLL
ncbi:hypothetical protein LXL04_000216 [Taraxacum kok-saghyz]